MVELINPFYHRLELTWLDIFYLLVTGPVLVPIGVSLVLMITLLTWLVARVGLTGLTTNQLAYIPLTGWRHVCQEIFWISSSHLMFWAMGFRYGFTDKLMRKIFFFFSYKDLFDRK